MCYTDTDSLLFQVETPNVYDDMLMTADEYDFNEYPTDDPCYSTVNKKTPGVFKDECHSRPIAEFVGLRPNATLSGFFYDPSISLRKKRHFWKDNIFFGVCFFICIGVCCCIFVFIVLI
jgi:hypothetical protein